MAFFDPSDDIHRPNQKLLDDAAFHVKLWELMKFKRQKELQFGKDWDLEEERSRRRFEALRISEAADDAAIVKKKSKIYSFEDLRRDIKLSLAAHAARLEGKIVVEDRSMFRQDIDVHLYKTRKPGTSHKTGPDNDDVEDLLRNIKLSLATHAARLEGKLAQANDDDLAEVHMEPPQGTLT